MIENVIRRMMPAGLLDCLNSLLQNRKARRRAAALAEKSRTKIEALLQSPLPIKLELGAGENRGLPGWTYVDANEQCDLALDLSQPLPFPNGSVDMIYSSHLLEHFKYADLTRFLGECLRILRPGGRFSAAVPNARIYLNAYQDPADFKPEIFCRYAPAYNNISKIDYVNYLAYMDGHHQYMFDEESIIVILERAGFKQVMLRAFDKTLDLEARDYQSIYVKADK